MAALIRKLVTIGSSQGLILPVMLLEMLGWDRSTELVLKIEGSTLIVSPVLSGKKRQRQEVEK